MLDTLYISESLVKIPPNKQDREQNNFRKIDRLYLSMYVVRTLTQASRVSLCNHPYTLSKRNDGKQVPMNIKRNFLTGQ